MPAARDGDRADDAATAVPDPDRPANRRCASGDGGVGDSAENAQDERHRLLTGGSASAAASERPQRDRLVLPPLSTLPLGTFMSFLRLTTALVLIVGLSFWADEVRKRTNRAPICSGGSSIGRGVTPVGPIFVFTAGIEGTGHHFLKDIIMKSPSVQWLQHHPKALRHLANMRAALMHGVMMPFCDDLPMNDPLLMYQNLTENLRQVHDLLQSSNGIRYIPVNILTGWEGNHMLSYPDSKRCDRILHPNLDVFYAACRDAGVRCGAVYLHRDPLDVLRSAFRRHFFRRPAEGAHRYALMLQALYAQLAYAPRQTLACLGLYRDEDDRSATATGGGRRGAASDFDEWDPGPLIRDMFGWSNDPGAFDRCWAATQQQGNTTSKSNGTLLSLQPSDRVHVEAMVRAHDQVLQLCRRQVRANRDTFEQCG